MRCNRIIRIFNYAKRSQNKRKRETENRTDKKMNIKRIDLNLPISIVTLSMF